MANQNGVYGRQAVSNATTNAAPTSVARWGLPDGSAQTTETCSRSPALATALTQRSRQASWMTCGNTTWAAASGFGGKALLTSVKPARTSRARSISSSSVIRTTMWERVAGLPAGCPVRPVRSSIQLFFCRHVLREKKHNV